MIKNYLTISFRHLLKNKVYVIINAVGTGIAIACGLTAYLLIGYNYEFDDYFNGKKAQNIVKVMHHFKTSGGNSDQELAIPVGLSERVFQEVSGIENVTRFCNQHGILSSEHDSFFENIRFADASFFDMFHPELKYGSYKNFKARETVYLTEPIAKKHFGDIDPTGKPVTIEINERLYEVLVGGVFEKLPLNISFTLDVLLRIELYFDANSISSNSLDHYTSALFSLTDSKNTRFAGEQLNIYLSEINASDKERISTSFELIPFERKVINGEVSASDLRLPIPTMALLVFGILATIILLIACFNFTNTTLALTNTRFKEIGVRKVVGARKSGIVIQSLIETTLTILVAISLGVLMAQIIVPRFATMWRLEFGLGDLSTTNFIMIIGLLVMAIVTLAGIYPAFQNSNLKPIELLKGKRKIRGTNIFSQTLLVLQFSLSVIMLIAGVVFTQNAQYQKELDFGYDYKDVIAITLYGEDDFTRFKNQISGFSQIKEIAGAKNPIGPYTALKGRFTIDTTQFTSDLHFIGDNYFNAIGLNLSRGRNFNAEMISDRESSLIVDENFVSNHNLANPVDARVIFDEKPYRIIGVVENHLSGLKKERKTEHVFALAVNTDFKSMLIKTIGGENPAIFTYLEKEWRKINPAKPFLGIMQEEILFEEANGYNNNLTQIFFFLTTLGSLLSAFGIYALAKLNVQLRFREIGIRKTLGSGVSNIIKLLNREFALILTIAAIAGGFIGYFMTNALLDDLYTYHLEISIFTLLVSGVSIFIIGIISTSSTIFRAANTNPIEILKDE